MVGCVDSEGLLGAAKPEDFLEDFTDELSTTISAEESRESVMAEDMLEIKASCFLS